MNFLLLLFVVILVVALSTPSGNLVCGFVGVSNQRQQHQKHRTFTCHHVTELNSHDVQQQQQQRETQQQKEHEQKQDLFGKGIKNSLSSRRNVLQRSVAAVLLSIPTSTALFFNTNENVVAFAAERPQLDDLLYRILRVREATQQETRLITSGQFKDIQRANIKLAIKFMIDNYRLNDAFVAASTYIDGSTSTKLEAGQVGQKAVQNLYTILEYFDSADVQNLKVSICLSICICVYS